MEDKVHHEHDVGYKYLLSAKQVFVQLLRTFVDKGWVQHIEEENIKKVNKSFVLADFQNKEADLVYEMKIRERKVIFYILTELQSTVDYQMPYRLLLYMVEIWREIIKDTKEKLTKQKEFRLPAIIPIVLYNGEAEWTTPLEFKEMLHDAPIFGENVLNFKYILLEVHSYDENDLLEISNLIASVFYIDRSIKNMKEMVDRLKRLTETLNKLSNKEFGLFTNWFKRIVLKRFPDKKRKELEDIINQAKPKEAEKMISPLGESIERHLRKAKEDGIERGKKEGIEEGIEKGIEEGAKEKAVEIARKLLQMGMPTDEVAEITGLSRDEIRKVK